MIQTACTCSSSGQPNTVSVSAFQLSSLLVIWLKHVFCPKEAFSAKMTVSAKRECLVNHWFSISLPFLNTFLLCWYYSQSVWVQNSDKPRINWHAETVLWPKKCIFGRNKCFGWSFGFLKALVLVSAYFGFGLFRLTTMFKGWTDGKLPLSIHSTALACPPAKK